MNKFHFRQSQSEIRQKYKVQSVMSIPHVLRRSQAHGEHLPRYKTQQHPPYFSEIGKIKGKIYDASLMEKHKDDKVNNDNVKYIIPMKRYAKPFKEKLSSESFHLAPMQNH
jgi:hypothetical protein